MATSTKTRTPRRAAGAKKSPSKAKRSTNNHVAALAPFDGRDVLSSKVQITNAGDGLSKALAVDPTEMHHGETVFVVLECGVEKVGFVPVKDTDCLERVHTLKTKSATMVEGDAVRDALAAQQERIEAHRGVTHLPGLGAHDGDGADSDDGDDSASE